MMAFVYSKYYRDLSGEAITRYEDKLKMILYVKDLYCYLEGDNSSLSGL